MLYPNLYVIGLTGNIATGKSTVGRMLKEEGAALVDTDLIARQVVEPYSPGWQLILRHFGWEVLLPDSTLNRKKLGAIVFNSQEKRTLLGKILHPYIKAEVRRRLIELSRKASKKETLLPVVLIVPLLFEAGYDREVDSIWITTATPSTQLTRLTQRDGLTEEEALSRINAQEGQESKIPRSQIIIDSETPLEEMRTEVLRQFQKIKETLSTQ